MAGVALVLIALESVPAAPGFSQALACDGGVLAAAAECWGLKARF